MGIVNLFIMSSGMLLQPVIAFFLDLGWKGALYQGMRIYSFTTFRNAFLLLPVLMIVAAVVAYFMKESHPSHARVGVG